MKAFVITDKQRKFFLNKNIGAGYGGVYKEFDLATIYKSKGAAQGVANKHKGIVVSVTVTLDDMPE